MARGQGPKLVIDVGHDLKRKLHGKLALEGRTVKDWLTERIQSYVGVEQLSLYPPVPPPPPDGASNAPQSLSQPRSTVTGSRALSDLADKPLKSASRRKRLSAARSGRSKPK